MKKPTAKRKKQTGAENLRATGRRATYIYVTEAEMDMIRDAAMSENRSIANFCTQTAIDAAKEILKKKEEQT